MNRDGLVDLFSKIGVERIRVHDHSGNIQIACPLAAWTHDRGTDRNPSCSVKIADGDVSLFRCFSCGRAGTLTQLVQTLSGHRGGALDELAKQVAEAEKQDLSTLADRAAARFAPKAPLKKKVDFDVWDEKEIAPWVGRVPQYIIDRGVPLAVCKEWGLGHDTEEGRVVFPVRRFPDGALVGATGRAIADVEPRYRDYWGFHKERYLYGECKLDLTKKRVIVVEGFVKVLKLWTWGYRNVVATMMAVPSKAQMGKLRDWGVDVFMAQDGNEAGRLGREKFVQTVKGRIRLFDVPIPDGKGPDDIPPEALEAAIERATLVL
jgi:DNA primase